MQHPDEGTIHAWLDGALQQEESAALEAHVATCQQCRAAVAEARGLIAASSRIVSALDTGPAGVIPARAASRRAWYAGPQLRAAAAVLFVAGASMIILRGRGSAPVADTAQRVMSEAVPQEAPKEVPQAESLSRAVAKTPATTRAADAATGTTVGASDATTESDAMAAPVAVAAPLARTSPSPTPATAAARQRPFNSSTPVDNVVVTGVATGTAGAVDGRLTVVGVDSTAGTRITRYRLASGEEIALSETRPVPSPVVSAQAERRAESARDMAAPSAPPPAPPPKMDSAAAAAMTEISWADPKNNRRYTLSGRVSRERLEQLRKTIESTRR